MLNTARHFRLKIYDVLPDVKYLQWNMHINSLLRKLCQKLRLIKYLAKKKLDIFICFSTLLTLLDTNYTSEKHLANVQHLMTWRQKATIGDKI